MTRAMILVAALVLTGCGGSETSGTDQARAWGCCDFYPVLSSSPVEGGRELRLLDCDLVRQFTCFWPEPNTVDRAAEVSCWDDANDPVPYWSTDRGC